MGGYGVGWGVWGGGGGEGGGESSDGKETETEGVRLESKCVYK